jgi:hypothetical protein
MLIGEYSETTPMRCEGREGLDRGVKASRDSPLIAGNA